MLKNGRPYHLPQVSMPVDLVTQKLDEEEIDYELISIKPSDGDGIMPSQKFIYSDEVGKANLNDMNPIYLAGEEDNLEICDGHHRYFKALLDNKSVTAVKIKMNSKDACRLLNKIQDVFDYSEQQKMEEVVAQDQINAENQGMSYNKFLSALEEDNAGVQTETPSKNDQTVIAYRREPIRENSVVGNFFTLNPVEGFSKYQIDFENLLDTNALGVQYKDSQVPADILAKIWFPHVNFEKLGEQYNVPSLNLKNKAIAEKARHMGYDGIKYGDSLILGLK